MKKIIVFGVIVLFVGMCFQPAFAVENRVSTNKVEKVEDCDCQEVSNSDFLMIKELLTELDEYTNTIIKRFGHIPEVKEKCQELLDAINIDISTLDELCTDLDFLIFVIMIVGFFFLYLMEQNEGTIWEPIFEGIAFIILLFDGPLVFIYEKVLKCGEWWPDYELGNELGKLNEIKQIVSI